MKGLSVAPFELSDPHCAHSVPPESGRERGSKMHRPAAWRVAERWTLILLLLGIPALAACTSRVPSNDVARYVVAIDDIEEAWTERAAAAFEGKEYLGTGKDPPASLTLDDLLTDMEENFSELVRVTRIALAGLAEVDPPPRARSFHAEFIDVLDGHVEAWLDGLSILRKRELDTLPQELDRVSVRGESLQARLDALGPERDALARLANEIG